MTEVGHSLRRRWTRVAVTALAFPGVVALSYAAVTATDDPNLDAGSVAAGLGPLVIYGAVVGRAWTLALPLAWGALFLGVLRLADLLSGGCSVCGEDEDWGNYPLFFAIGRDPAGHRCRPGRPDRRLGHQSFAPGGLTDAAAALPIASTS